MNLEERIKAGMLFYESGHVDPVNQEIEERLKNERKDCKELMFDYNHCRPGDQDRQLKILKELLGSCGNAAILPGVSIGDNTVIGAGSVVTRDIPANVVAVGNPCRVLREISDRDKEYYFRDMKVDFPYASEKKMD